MYQLVIFIPLILGFVISYIFRNENNFNKDGETKPFWQPPGYMFSIIWSTLYLLNGFALYYVLTNYKGMEWNKLTIILSLFVLQLILENSWVIYTTQIKKVIFTNY